jgi:hypothetical protein
VLPGLQEASAEKFAQIFEADGDGFLQGNVSKQ